MRLLAAILLLASTPPVGAGAQVPPPTERIPNPPPGHPDNAYPRWLSWVVPNGRLVSPPTVHFVGRHSSMAVDSRNHVHLVGVAPYTRPDSMITESIIYQNSSFESRRPNGFSAPVVLTENVTVREVAMDPDVCVDASDRLHLVWAEFMPGPTPRGALHYRRRDAGGWGPVVDLSAANPAPRRTRYTTPQIRCGTDGSVHVIALGQNLETETDPDVEIALRRHAVHLTVQAGTTYNIIPPTRGFRDTPTSGSEGADYIRFALDPSNTPVIAFTAFVFPPFQTLTFTSSGSGMSWSARAPFGFPAKPDLTVDRFGGRHFVWIEGIRPNATVYYRLNAGARDPVTHPLIDHPDHEVFPPRVLVDSRDQIHVLWMHNLDLAYAARVKNPDPNVVDPTWRRQTGIVTPGRELIPVFSFGTPPFPITQALITKNDQIHVTTNHHYTRTMEYGLGARDPQAMVGILPGGAANAASGNLHFSLPLFSAGGVGPAVACGLFYNALEMQSGYLSQGWRLNYEMHLVDHWRAVNHGFESITLFLPDGRPVHFSGNTGGVLTPDGAEGYFATLQRATLSLAPDYRLTSNHGEVLWFNGAGKLRRIEEPTGNFLELSYDASGRLTSITDMLGNGGPGRTTMLAYEGGGDERYPRRVTEIMDPDGKRYGLGYTGNHLTTVSFLSGPGTPTWRFEYSATSNPATKERVNQARRFLPPRGHAAGYGYTCGYLPDGRLAEVEDPAEAFLLDNEGDATPPSVRAARMTVSYDETVPVTDIRRKTWVVDRRGFRTLFVVEARRSLAREIHDEAALTSVPGIFQVVRTFNGFGQVIDLQDRWGFHTVNVYPDPAHENVTLLELDNLREVRRPRGTGTGEERVVAYTHTQDGFNRVRTMTTFATPTDGTAPVARVTQYEYDAFGQRVREKFPDVQRPDGTVQSNVFRAYEYNGSRRQLSRVINEEDHGTGFSLFDPVHGLAQRMLREGGTQPEEYAYDRMGNRTQIRLPRGGPGNELPGPTVIARDGLYRAETVTDPKGKVTRYEYDVDSNLVTVIPAAGLPTRTFFDRRGSVAGSDTPDGSWSQAVDATGNVRRVRDIRGFTSHTDWDFAGRIKETRTPGASTTVDGGGGPAFQVMRYVHDGLEGAVHFSSVTEVGAPADRTRRTEYDNRGRAVRAIQPDNLTRRETFFDEQDQVVAAQLFYGEALQTCTVTFRDARDRVDRMRLQNAPYRGAFTSQSTTVTLLNRAGSVVGTVDPLGDTGAPGPAHKTRYVLDRRERVILVVDGKGDVVEERIHGDDDLVMEMRVPDPDSKGTALVTARTYTYTARKEVLASLNRAGHGMTFTYGDFEGQQVTATDALGRLTHMTYYADTQRRDEVIEAQGTPGENRTKQIWTNALPTEMRVWNPATSAYDASYRRSYDQAGRLERFEGPAVAAERYLYNPFSEVRQFVAGMKTIAHAYNPLGQRTQSAWTGAYSVTQTRTYDGRGLLQSVHDGSLGRVLSYEAWKGTPLHETFRVGQANWKIQTHSTDAAMNYTNLLDAELGEHAWPVDENNRVTEKRFGPQAVGAMTYTPGGLPDREIRKDASGQVIATTTHRYDGLSRKARSQTVQAGTGEVLADYGWEYNAADEITKTVVRHLGAEFTIQNDERGQLRNEVTPGNGGGLTPPPYANVLGAPGTGLKSLASGEARGRPRALLPVPARSASYTYDPAGNRRTQTIDGVVSTLTYNAAGQLVTESAPGRTVTHEYDEWGNETVRRATVGATTTIETYGYNHLNLLSSYTSSATGAAWQYDYWPSGERYAKTSLSTNSGEVYVPRFGDVATEYDRTVTTTSVLLAHRNTYVQGTGIDTKSTRIGSGPGGRRHYLGDLVGSVGVSLTDLGEPADTIVRDSWGLQIAGASSERYGFAQREHDAESGLVHMRSRSYDPRIGRFTQNDPIRANRPFDHYSYARNSPLSGTDPTGQIMKFTRHGTGAGNQAIMDGLREVFGVGPLKVDTLNNTVHFEGPGVLYGHFKGLLGDFVSKAKSETVYSLEEWLESATKDPAEGALVRSKIEEAYKYLTSDGRNRTLEFVIGVANAAAQPVYIVNDIGYGLGAPTEPKSAMLQYGVKRGLEGASLGQIWVENTTIGTAYANPVTGPILGAYHIAHGVATDNPEEAGGGAFVLGGTGASWFAKGGGPRINQVQDASIRSRVTQTMQDASSGTPRVTRDGTVFQNREGLLPNRASGYYTEWTVPTPGVQGRGAMRIVRGDKGQAYFTSDHYGTFLRVDGISPAPPFVGPLPFDSGK